MLRQIAREHQVTEEEVRRDMKEALDAGSNNSDPTVQAKWVGFEYAGDETTREKVVFLDGGAD